MFSENFDKNMKVRYTKSCNLDVERLPYAARKIDVTKLVDPMQDARIPLATFIRPREGSDFLFESIENLVMFHRQA